MKKRKSKIKVRNYIGIISAVATPLSFDLLNIKYFSIILCRFNQFFLFEKNSRESLMILALILYCKFKNAALHLIAFLCTFELFF